MLRLKSLGLDKREILYRVTQENSIENSIQDSLPLYTESSEAVLAISNLP